MRPLEPGDRDADPEFSGTACGIGLSNDGTAKSFVDVWDVDIVDDHRIDFANAVESARWLDPREGRIGTLAKKAPDAVVLITHQRMPRAQAGALARQLIEDSDARITGPNAPAGAIPIRQDGPFTSRIGWCFFGWAPYEPWPIDP